MFSIYTYLPASSASSSALSGSRACENYKISHDPIPSITVSYRNMLFRLYSMMSARVGLSSVTRRVAFAPIIGECASLSCKVV